MCSRESLLGKMLKSILFLDLNRVSFLRELFFNVIYFGGNR